MNVGDEALPWYIKTWSPKDPMTKSPESEPTEATSGFIVVPSLFAVVICIMLPAVILLVAVHVSVASPLTE